MSEPIWLSVADILALHTLQIEENGGDPAMRDARRLESAAQRPRNLHAYGAPSLAEMAAAYAAGIIQGHPFVDGNKRTGFATAAVFLQLNGCRLVATEPDATLQVLGLAAGEISEERFARWLASRIESGSVGEPAPTSQERRTKPRKRPAAKSRRR
jgi:death-on-curing protein